MNWKHFFPPGEFASFIPTSWRRHSQTQRGSPDPLLVVLGDLNNGHLSRELTQYRDQCYNTISWGPTRGSSPCTGTLGSFPGPPDSHLQAHTEARCEFVRAVERWRSGGSPGQTGQRGVLPQDRYPYWSCSHPSSQGGAVRRPRPPSLIVTIRWRVWMFFLCEVQ